MKFGTSIHCMDGRIQEPIIRYIKSHYAITYVDTITEPGPCGILSEQSDRSLLESMDRRVFISLDKHGSTIIFISGHHDCAGNPVPKEVQVEQLRKSEIYLRSKYPAATIVMLWINENWEVEKID